jgi:hypothetical protein
MQIMKFTKGSSPLNSALPVEETYRENADNKNECQLVLLDATSAFDVVMHSHLMRRVYHAGIQDKHWSLRSLLRIPPCRTP